MKNIEEEIQHIINRLTDDDGYAYPDTYQVKEALKELHKLKAKVKNISYNLVLSDEVCGKCEHLMEDRVDAENFSYCGKCGVIVYE